jgi:MoxR-like ATPase
MQEKQVSVGNTTFELDKPFFVLATQNPIEQEGTYPLPEAQQDRFLLKILVDYPSFEDEMKIVNIYTEGGKPATLKPMLNKTHILSLQELVREVPIANDIKQRAVKIVQATRNNKDIIHYGASPRASIGIILAAKALALIEGRNHVGMADIEQMALPVLRHRIILNFEAERKGMGTDDAIKEILKKVK